MAIFPAIALSQRPDLSRMPKLRLLSQWASDYLLGKPSFYLQHVQVRSGSQAASGSNLLLAKAFIARLDDYAQIPSLDVKVAAYSAVLKMFLLDRETRLTLVSKFLEAVPLRMLIFKSNAQGV